MAAKFFIYRNLHKKCWSLRHHGRVIGHHQWLRFQGDSAGVYAGFQVSEKGRQKVIAERRKNVHAYVWGYYIEQDEAQVAKWFSEKDKASLVQVSYNPYQAGNFVRKDTGAPVSFAREIWLTPCGVFVVDPGV